ncbi:response regulator [Roseovarius arcticus]|uniref:response regulator n=1 Tax=Roseovarius arcticus TaxID=2547404 RepID=UPI0011104B4A|nr:response regulator transcription factor [Roseovarius arcticus]
MTVNQILVVDDDPKMCTLLRRTLESEGFVVFEADCEAEALQTMDENAISLISLDLNLGHENGFAIARAIRRISSVPIIMVTAKDDVIDRVAGLEAGADDYITKPFHPREVIARVRAVLRRSPSQPLDADPGGTATAPVERSGEAGAVVLSFDELTAYPESFELICRDGSLADLTNGEFRLLQVFFENPKRILSRERIMDLLNGTEWTPLDRAIDNQVARLRRKIERDPAKPVLIKTVRGIGYMFSATVVSQ